MSTQHNLLVISDLHLGEDLCEGNERGHHADETEAELVGFLRYYSSHREHGLPWRLVINGDMIDFLSISITPEELGLDVEELGALEATSDAARAKLGRVFERHEGFFLALTQFVEQGNELHMVVGNHDAELHWPDVQEDFFSKLAAFSKDGNGAAIRSRVFLHPWFFIEPGVAFLEHGHQYDGFCSFDDPLQPDNPSSGTLEENLGTAAMRYLGNHLPLDPEAAADLSFVEYLHLLVNSRHDVPWKFIGGYAAVVNALWSQWVARITHPGEYRKRKKRRKEHMRRISEKSGVRFEVLEKLHRLRRPPVFLDLFRLMRSVMLGRLLTSILLLASIPLIIPLFPWPTNLYVLLGATTMVGLIHLWLALSRENVDPTNEMRNIAGKVSKLTGAPIVTFGHSHVPLVHRLGRNRWYFNSGSWAGGSGRRNAFTHLVIRHDGGRVKAALCRWGEGRSRELRAERLEYRALKAARAGMQSGY